MTKPEIRINDEAPMTNQSAARRFLHPIAPLIARRACLLSNLALLGHSAFIIDSNFGFRHSDFHQIGFQSVDALRHPPTLARVGFFTAAGRALHGGCRWKWIEAKVRERTFHEAGID